MVYVLLRSILIDWNGGGHELDSLYVFDGTTKTFVDCRSCRLDWKSQTLLSDDGHNYFAIDSESGTIFVTSVAKKRLFALPPRGGEPLSSLKIGRGCSGIAITPYSKKAYVCYKKMIGGNSIDVITLGESTEPHCKLPIARA